MLAGCSTGNDADSHTCEGDTDECLSAATISVQNIELYNLDYGMGWNMSGKDETPLEAQADFYKILQWTRCKIARIQYYYEYCETANDNDAPYSFNWDGFSLDGTMSQQYLAQGEMLENLGIDYIYANWSATGEQGGEKELDNGWLVGGSQNLDDPQWESIKDFYIQEVGENVAAFVKIMKENGGHPHFVGFSTNNEPEGFFLNVWYPHDIVWPSFTEISTRLTELGLRDQIKLWGPETCMPPEDPAEGITAMVTRYGTDLDVAVEHAYQFYYGGFDYEGGTTIGNTIVPHYAQLKKDLKAAYGHDVPIVLGEFSGRIGDDAVTMSPAELYTDQLEVAEIAIRLMNVGVGGFCHWLFGTGEPSGEPQLGTFIYDGDKLTIQGSVLYPHAVLSRYIDKGWKVISQSVAGGTMSGVQRVFATVLRAPNGSNTTILVVNDGTESTQVTVDLSSLLSSGTLHNVYCAGPAPDGIYQDDDVVLSNGVGSFDIRPRSVVALTTMEVGSLDPYGSDIP